MRRGHGDATAIKIYLALHFPICAFEGSYNVMRFLKTLSVIFWLNRVNIFASWETLVFLLTGPLKWEDKEEKDVASPLTAEPGL